MPVRQLPVRPDVQHVKREAKQLLRVFREGDATALADFREFGPKALDAAAAQLSDAQLVLARSYGATSFPQLIAAIEFIGACWSNDGNRVREAVLAHAEILADYYKTPHDGWRGDLSAAAMRGTGIAITHMRNSGALIADVAARQEHVREWAQILPILSRLGNPFARAREDAAPRAPRSLAEVQEALRKVTERADPETGSEDEARRLRLEQHMRDAAQDPTKVNRTFERMRAHNTQFPAESAPSPDLRRKLELMNECLRLYIESHPPR